MLPGFLNGNRGGILERGRRCAMERSPVAQPGDSKPLDGIPVFFDELVIALRSATGVGDVGNSARITGPAIAAASRPTVERDGVLTVSCEAAVWAQELDLMEQDLLARLHTALGTRAIRALRCRPA